MEGRLFRGLGLQLCGPQRWRDRNEEPRSAWPGVGGFCSRWSNGAMEHEGQKLAKYQVGEWPGWLPRAAREAHVSIWVLGAL